MGGFSAFHKWNALVGLSLIKDYRELETWLFPNKYVIVENASSPLSTMADPGEGAGSPPPPPPPPPLIFRPNWDLENFFGHRPTSLISGCGWPGPLLFQVEWPGPPYFRLNDRVPPPLIWRSGFTIGQGPLLSCSSFAKGMKKSMNLRRFCKTKPLSASFPLKNFNPFYELYIFYKFFCLLVWASEEERVDAWA